MFSRVSVNRVTQKTHLICMKFYGMVGHNPATNQLDFGLP